MKGINVLSLFGGGETGRLALEKAGIKVNKYYSSEIDQHCIAVSTFLHPTVIHIGDITKVSYALDSLYWGGMKEGYPYADVKIDLIIGGSPCQTVSMAGNMAGLEGTSGLVSEYVRVLNEVRTCNPKVKFLLENVKMKTAFLRQFNELMGCEPMLISASLVSPQYRRRYYWTNIEGVTQPEDRKMVVADILESNASVPQSMWMKQSMLDKVHTITKTKPLNVNEPCCLAIVAESHKPKGNYLPRERVFSAYGKARTVSTSFGQHPWYMVSTGYRKLTIVERERLQSLPDNYTKFGVYNGVVKEVPLGQRDKIVGNGWNAEVVAHILSFMKKDSTLFGKFKSLINWR